MTQQEFQERYIFNLKEDNIGGGSFGTVYKAYDTILHREVAIKVSEVKHVGNKEFSLLEEFKAIESVPANKYIANYEKVYRFESFQGVFDYGLMQYYPLGNLSHYLKNNTVSQEKPESLVLGILEGIGFLHQHKVVHRDLKPSNILVVERKRVLTPIITDFGLSKQASADTKASRFTNSFAGGTLQYSSPEQLKGLPLKLNTDLWSFGVIAYEILTGNTLFEADTQGTASAEWQNAITQKILNEDVNEQLQTLPAKWQKVIRACLERDLTKRVQSTDALLVLLNNESTEPKTKQPTPLVKPNNNKTVYKAKPVLDKKEPKTKPTQKKSKPKWLVPTIAVIAAIALGLAGYFGFKGEAATTNLQIFEQDGLYGYKQGDSIAIPAQFTLARSFNEGKAYVKTQDSSYYINSKGLWLEKDIANTDNTINQEDNTEQERLVEAKKADQQAWGRAKNKNTKAAYQKYLDQNLDGNFRSQAQQAITTLEKAKTDTEEQNRLAEAKKADQQAWNKAKNKNTKVAYQNYLDQNPKGNYRSKAQTAISKIERETSDRDGDGILDKNDACPDIMGPAVNNGCPKIDIIPVLNAYSRTIVLKDIMDFIDQENSIKKNIEILNNIIDVMNEYKNASFNIEGHCSFKKRKDNGKEDNIIILSERFPNKIRKYLIKQGIAKNRLFVIGHGSSSPLSSNGINMNNRVEINLKK